MKSYKKLINNSIIFGIGTLGSKIISFLLVPLYTYYLSTAEYGTVDLTITTVNMLLPIVSASIFEAVLRFVMDSNGRDNQSTGHTLSNSIIIALWGFFISLLFYPLMSYFRLLEGNIFYLYVILLVQIFEKVFAQYTRAVGKVKKFAFNGILLTFSTAILNILFLVYFDLGVLGYYWAIIIANFISVLYLFISSGAIKDVKIKYVNLNTIKELFNYSVPLIPNSLMWWLINASSRYFIRVFSGIAANGLFAVASRIPSLLNIVNQVFAQAWQLSAIEEYESKNKSEFYSNIFKYLSSVMFLATSGIIVILKKTFEILFASDYFSAWKIVPFLLLGAVFASFSGFLGTNYIAAKETKGVLKTSIFGGVISLILNTLFIPSFGIIGAGISSMMSFIAMFLIRLVDTRQFVSIKVNWSIFLLNISIIFLQIGILFMSLSQIGELTIQVILFSVILFINRNLFLKIFKKEK